MKKLFLIVLATGLMFSCQKNEEPVAVQQEVSFNPIDASIGGLKENVVECPNGLIPDYAEIKISGTTYYSEIFYIDGVPYTKAIKLDPGTYNVQKFILWDDGGTPGNMGTDSDDVMVKATPNGSSDYAQWVTKTVPFQIDVNEFEKLEVSVDVLCFTEVDWEAFGFDCFQITEMTIREQCFFGDICVDPADYVGSMYDDPCGTLGVDLPAIFKVDVYNNEVFENSYSNESFCGHGAPLCVQYADYDNKTDNFSFELWVYVKVDDGFDFVKFYTWNFTDDYMIPAGDDQVVEFVIGNCAITPPEITFPPYDPENPPNGDEICETVFAYNQGGEDGQTRFCFLDLKKIDASYNPGGVNSDNFNRWGWTNELLEEGQYTFEIWGAAGQCDLSSGTLVGNLVVDYEHGSGDVVVTYNMNTGYTLSEVQIYVGSKRLPEKKQGQNYVYTVAPGQYPWVVDDLNAETTYSHTFSGMTGAIYVVAHAKVCGVYN